MIEHTSFPRRTVRTIATAAILALLVGLLGSASAAAAAPKHSRCDRVHAAKLHRACRRRPHRRVKLAHVALVARRRAAVAAAAARRGVVRKPQVTPVSHPAPTPSTPSGTTTASEPGASGSASPAPTQVPSGSSSPSSLPSTPSTPAGTSQTWSCGWGSFSDNAGSFNLPSACWRPFADSSWVNTPLPANPKLASSGIDGENGDSAQLVSALMSNGSGGVAALQPVEPTSWQHAMYFSSPSDPVYTISCAHSTRNCAQENDAEGDQVHIPCGATVPTGTDMQIFVIDQSSGYEYDMGGLIPGQRLCGGGTFYVGLATKVPLNGDGRGSCAADAACVGMSAGQIRESELQAGSINHALFIVDGNCDSSGTPASLYPADPDNTCGGGDAGAPKLGQWYYLALSDAQIAATGFPGWQQTILRAMAHYGMFVGDQGSNHGFDLMAEDPGTWSGFNKPNPWVPYAQSLAQNPGNQIQSSTTSWVDFSFDNIPQSFWVNNLRAVDPCVIQGTCSAS